MLITESEAGQVRGAALVAAMNRGLAQPVEVARVGKGLEVLGGSELPGYYAHGFYGPERSKFTMVFAWEGEDYRVIVATSA